MHSDRRTNWLADIADNIRRAQRFLGEMSLETFAADEKSIFAVVRCLEIISEASRRLDATTKQRHPHIPWPQIAGSGNIYRHDYPSVQTKLVWETVRNALPPLLAAVEAKLDQPSSP